MVESTSVVCSGPGGTWGPGGLGASSWGNLAVKVKLGFKNASYCLQAMVVSDGGHHCYQASESAYDDCVVTLA